MKPLRTLIALAALASVGLMTTTAQAANILFSYAVTTTFNGETSGPGLALTNLIDLGDGNLMSVTGSLAPTNTTPTDINLATFQITGPGTSGPIDIDFNLALEITESSSGESAIFDIGGVLSISNLTGTSAIQEVVWNPLPSSQTIGGIPFFITVPRFTPDTVNNPNSTGGFGVRVSAIPEPASLAMAGLGLVSVAGIGIHRRRRS